MPFSRLTRYMPAAKAEPVLLKATLHLVNQEITKRVDADKQ